MEFTKMQGAANDFIVIDNRDKGLSEKELSALAKNLCPRRFAVGADGLMAVELPEKDGDFRMRFFNADGSQGEMCGNGARCIARYAFDHEIAGKEMRIETTAGMVYANRLAEDVYKVRLNDVTKMELHKELEVSGRTYDCDYVELGDPPLPHLAVEYPGLEATDPAELWALGKALRSHPELPKGANVNFYEIQDSGKIFERTFERGVEDFTYACGTGTASVAAALTARGRVAEDAAVEVTMAGGVLAVEVKQNRLYLCGPAVIVYEGKIQ